VNRHQTLLFKCNLRLYNVEPRRQVAGLRVKRQDCARVGPHSGRVVQLDPMKPTLNSPGSRHLQLRYGKVTGFKCCFQFQLAPVHCGGRADAAGGARRQRVRVRVVQLE